MMTGFLIGVIAGLCLSSLWGLFNRLITRPGAHVDSGEHESARPLIGPFLHKKPKARKKPVSHDDVADWEREMREQGRLL